MSSSKPIVGIMNGEEAEIIREAKCEQCAPAGDFKKLASTVLQRYKLENKNRLERGLSVFEYDEDGIKLESCINSCEVIIKKS